MVQSPRSAGDPNFSPVLWLLQPLARGSIQQKVFPEDDFTRLQSKALPVRETTSEDDLVYGVFSCSFACPRYLCLPGMLESRHGNIRQGHHAKEVQIGLG
jgi:hypothetical protein